jgi:hypothetical protein
MQRQQNKDKNKPMATTSTLASNYWTATAQHVMPVMPVLQRKEQEQDEEERWNQYKFGLCPLCKIGLDDKSEFTFNYTTNGDDNGTMMCFDCDAKLSLRK